LGDFGGFYSPNLQRHTIVAGASYDQTSADYIPVAYIGWELPADERGSHALLAPERFATFEEASAFALEAAKAWVDRHYHEVD
jgi:hypothetical protein